MTRTLVVVCADWPIRASGPHEPGRPVAVWSHRGIVACDRVARNAGVRVGLRRREAQGRCPELLLVPDDPARDAHHFDPVVAALGTLTPRVEIVEAGTAAFATRGPSRYFGGDDSLAERAHGLASSVTGDSSAVQVAVADGPLIARMATLRTPPGTTNVIAAGAAATFVDPIPLSAVAAFCPDPDIVATCRRLGLHTFGDVAALPAKAVSGRFGHGGIWLHRLARGDDPTVGAPVPIPAELDEIIEFDPPEARADAVAFVVRAAAETFVERLGTSGLSCSRVVISVATDHAEELERHWRLDGPGRSGEHARPPATLIAERARWQVDGWLSGPAATRPSAGIVRVVLSPGEVRPDVGIQHGLWGGASSADERATRAVARLEALLGPDGVCVIEARGGRDPGTETTLVPTATIDLCDPGRAGLGRTGSGRIDLGQPRSRPTSPSAEDAPWPGRIPAPSPTMVLGAPTPIELLDAAGNDIAVSSGGELGADPATLRFGGTGPTSRTRSIEVAAWAGPWPVDERWWDPVGRSRRARLQVVTRDGDAMLLARRDRRWWLTAIYA